MKPKLRKIDGTPPPSLDAHVLYVEKDGEELFPHLLHPEDCNVWIGTVPDNWGVTRRYYCAVTSEIENMGYDSMFPDGLTPGWFRLTPWYEHHPGGPWGPAWEDAGVEVEEFEVQA